MKTLKSIAAVAMLAAAGCSVLPFSEPEGGSAAAWSAISNGAPVRVAVYAGPGARGVGMFRWMQLADQSPDLDATYVDGAAICQGALRRADLLVMPGGKSDIEASELGEAGQKELRNFILRGGSYVGTCAGAFLLMNDGGASKGDKAANTRRKYLGIAPFRHLRGHWGGEAMLRVRYTKEAEALCGIKAGTRTERFNGGPVMIPSYPVPGADFKVMATFESNLHSDTARPGLPSMGGHASAVAGTFGRGRIWLFSGHPEYYPKTWSSLKGAFKYLTGRDVTFKVPQRKKGQLAVGWWCKPGPGPEAAELARSLVRDADFDVVPYSNDEILRTDLRHVDAVVVPDAADKGVVKALSPTNKVMQAFSSFLARGGKVVTWGEAAKMFEPHENLDTVAGAGSVPAALRAVKDAPPPPFRASSAPKAPNPVRAAVYFDKGVGGCASIRWIKLLSLSPDCVFTPVDAQDVRDGALAKADLYVAPGGGATTQANTLRTQGCSNIVSFVRNGGSYFGTCAGLYFMLTQTDAKKPRIGLVPYVSQSSPYRGGSELAIRFAKDAEMFGMAPKTVRRVRYHGGPVLLPAKPVPGADIRVVATYDCDGVYSFNTNTEPTMAHTPAIVAGTVDKGRVAGTSPHPESYTHTQDIIRGGLRFLTGREFNAEYPQRTRGNLSVGFHGAHIHKDGASLVDRLFREPTLDVRAVADETIAYGELEHCDALVISHPNMESVTRYVREFAQNGGRIVAFGSEKELKTIPADLPNVTACRSADAARLALLDL